MIVETRGKWQPFEALTCTTLEVGKTYTIKVKGLCQFAISKERPTTGEVSDKFVYTKTGDDKLWIKTGV